MKIEARVPAKGWRVVASTTLLFGSTIAYALLLNERYPIANWLIWRYLTEWSLAAGWGVACASAGHAIVRDGMGLRFPFREHLVLSFAVGVFGFGTAVFVAGILGLLNAWFFALCPVLVLAITGLRLLRYLNVRRIRLKTRAPTSNIWLGSPFTRAAQVLGAVGLALLLLQVMTPANVSFDAQWYHAAIAEGYAATGHIRRFPEGWFLGTLPQLATWIYTWAFLCPFATLAFRIELAAALEFVIFLGTLAAIPVAVRWLTRGERSYGTWAVLFLFPGIFVYDSNLNLSADHVLAFWALPLLLTGRRLLLANDGGINGSLCVLFAVIVAGALLTKYQVLYLFVALFVLLLVIVAGSITGCPERTTTLLAMTQRLGVVGGIVLILTAPHWLKNALWYHNPLYPFANAFFHGQPWVLGTQFRLLDPGWTPEGSMAERVTKTLRAVALFPFEPNDWFPFHRNVPVFGPLFSLLALPVLAIRPGGRLVALLFATLCAVASWYWTYHQDRYLQSLVPWMASLSAAALILLWQSRHKALRWAVGLLVGLQFLWSLDLPTLPTHAMAGRSPIIATFDRFSSGFRGALAEREDPSTALPKVAGILPKGAVALLHEQHLRLGLGRWVVSDGFGRQGGIRYRNWNQRNAVLEHLSALGVTHIVTRGDPTGDFSIADNIVFFDFIRSLPFVAEREGYRIFVLSGADRPSDTRGILLVGCSGVQMVTTFMDLDRLLEQPDETTCERGVPALSNVSQEARVIVVQPHAEGAVASLSPGWHSLFRKNGLIVLVDHR